MAVLRLFTDGSVNTLSKVGYGAYLLVGEHELPEVSLTERVKVNRFEHTSSTKLELQILLWALGDIQIIGNKLIVYTDSQNILSLQERRQRLEGSDYMSKSSRRIRNWKLYQDFYRMIDELDVTFVKVLGHMPGNTKNEIDQLFTFVDRASRKALRRKG